VKMICKFGVYLILSRSPPVSKSRIGQSSIELVFEILEKKIK
jgi:hypothetical protein